MPVNEIFKKRKSIRSYQVGISPTDEDLRTILEAGMLAPSGMNTRPWKFIVIRNRDKLNEVMKIHPYAKMLQTASVGIIVCADIETKKGISNQFFPLDCAAATENILLQSADLGLGTCWCVIYPNEDLIKDFKRIFNLEENIIPFNIIALGYPNEEFGSRGFYEENKVTWID